MSWRPNAEANIIKLPNISASVPRVEGGGPRSYEAKASRCPTMSPSTATEQKDARALYDKVKGSRPDPGPA